MLKYSPKTRQKNDYSAYTRIGNGTENIRAYNCLRKRLQGIQQASESQTNEKLNGEGLLSM